MEEGVETALRIARKGHAVLLSPAGDSFDMFDNYKHRGEVCAAAARRMAHVQPQ